MEVSDKEKQALVRVFSDPTFTEAFRKLIATLKESRMAIMELKQTGDAQTMAFMFAQANGGCSALNELSSYIDEFVRQSQDDPLANQT